MAFLTDPSERYQESYLEALREFQAEGRHLELSLTEVAASFGDFVQRLREQADPTKFKPGRVPNWVFWLIDGDDYIGRLILRTGLNEHLLQMGGNIGYEIRPSRRRQGYGKIILTYGLDRAKDFGLKRVLLTCDEDNLGSRRIIESHGGMLENIIEVEQWPAKVCRYWIQL
ncbi:MAG: GNAT family N-acetyltransferase [Ktedonobacteraceae bacterium]